MKKFKNIEDFINCLKEKENLVGILEYGGKPTRRKFFPIKLVVKEKVLMGCLLFCRQAKANNHASNFNSCTKYHILKRN